MGIYKNPGAKKLQLQLYEQKLKECNIEYEEMYVDTFAGKTHVTITGKNENPPLFVLHGIHAGAPLVLEAVKGLRHKFRIFAIDTIGQATKSDETPLSVKGNENAIWLAETMEKLQIKKAPIIGVSYGAFILQKLIVFFPDYIEKALFVVPAGFAKGEYFTSMKKLTLPLIQYLLFKNESRLLQFMDAFYTSIDDYSVAFQKNLLLGVKMDLNQPPLLSKEEVQDFTQPVYIMVAEDDIFFPGRQSLQVCQKIFKNFKNFHVLKNNKHIPGHNTYPEIESKLQDWLEAE
jgi:pimeloyl-ACP methyl ester carboxylesterase